MSLESAIADLVSASTQLTQSVNVTRATVEATRDSVIAQEAPVTTAKDATAASATAATTDTATTASKLTTAAADYATQKTTKGLAAVQTSADTELKDRLHRRDPARHPFRGARPSLVMDFVRRECHRNNAAGNLEPVDLNSFMTFTRASTATVVGPDGLIKEVASNVPRYGYDPVTGEALGLLIEEQRTNLFTASTDLTHANWGITNGGVIVKKASIVDPLGEVRSVRLEEVDGVNDVHQITQNPALTDDTNYTVSVYAKAGERIWFRVALTNKAGTTATQYFNLSAGVLGSASGSITATIAAVGNGWYRCCATINSGNSGTSNPIARIGVAVADNSVGYVGVGGQGLYVCAPQYEAGAFPTSYIPTPATFTGRASTKTYFDSNGVLQTAASGVAVTDHGYVDGRWVSKGLSLEPQATNLLTYSGTLTDASWGKPNGISVSGNTLSFVDAMSRVVKSVTPADGIYTLSARFSLADVGKEIKLAVWYAGKDGFSYANSTIPESGVVTTTVNATGITNVGIINSSAGTAQSVTLYPGTGIQFEAGPVATSYIPTTAAQVTRAADTSTSAQVTRAGEYGFVTRSAYGNEDGGVYAASWNCFGSGAGAYSTSSFVFTVAENAQNRLSLIHQPAGARGEVVYGSTVALAPSWAQAGTTLRRGALAVPRVGVPKYATSAAVAIGTSIVFKTFATRLYLGCNEYTSNSLNGYIKQLTYFPRQLSDADLQALTILED